MGGEVVVGLFTLSGTVIGLAGGLATEQLRARHAMRAQREEHAHDTRGSIRSDVVSAIAEFIERDYGAARSAALRWSAATTVRLSRPGVGPPGPQGRPGTEQQVPRRVGARNGRVPGVR